MNLSYLEYLLLMFEKLSFNLNDRIDLKSIILPLCNFTLSPLCDAENYRGDNILHVMKEHIAFFEIFRNSIDS